MMEYSNDLRFLSNIIQFTSVIANRIRYLLAENQTDKANELLNVMSNFTLLQSVRLDGSNHENLRFFQSLINPLPYSELNELKQIIDSTLAKIVVHKDSSL